MPSRVVRRLLGAGVIFIGAATPAIAHDVWINREKRTNTIGEWCCNEHDCQPIDPARVHENGIGFLLDTGDLVPYADAQVSGDNQYWLCKRPNRTVRCFFFPPRSS